MIQQQPGIPRHSSPRQSIRRSIASLLITVGVGGAVVACTESTPHQAAPPRSGPGSSIDISRIDAVRGDFPASFEVHAGRSKTFSAQDIGRTGINILTEARLDPPHCLPAIIPPYADLTVGTTAAGVTAAGDQGGIQVTALRLPQPVPATRPPAGCERVLVSGPPVTGAAESIPVPQVSDATTHGVKLLAAGQTDPDYILTAALNDQTTVVVRGNVAAVLHPQQFLTGLLVKAVAAVRGQQPTTPER